MWTWNILAIICFIGCIVSMIFDPESKQQNKLKQQGRDAICNTFNHMTAGNNDNQCVDSFGNSYDIDIKIK